VADQSDFSWPNSERAAVSLTFDDGVESQYETVVPMLNKRGFHGTIYVPMADGGRFYAAPEKWRDAVAAGHEIGNHSMTHPCSRNLWVAGKKLNLDDMTLDDIEAQIVEAKHRIEDALPDQSEHSYAYPCGETQVGRGANKQSYIPVVAKHYIAARALGDGISINTPAEVDLCSLWAPMPIGETAERLIDIAERAYNGKKWAIIAFHGIGDNHLSNTVEAFGSLLDWLAERRDEIWTDSLIRVARWVHDRQ
jgi:peptidoglycan/xylan/chitin deacetylase (PgdA/CDA1 family)